MFPFFHFIPSELARCNAAVCGSSAFPWAEKYFLPPISWKFYTSPSLHLLPWLWLFCASASQLCGQSSVPLSPSSISFPPSTSTAFFFPLSHSCLKNIAAVRACSKLHFSPIKTINPDSSIEAVQDLLGQEKKKRKTGENKEIWNVSVGVLRHNKLQ